MKIAFLAVFAISAIIHLYGSYVDNRKIRASSKGFILLGLLGWYCCSAEPVLPIVVAAIATSWLGDVLLIPHGTKWFAVGGVSFWASHICFTIAYAPQIDFGAFSIWAAVAAAVVYFVTVCLIFKGLRPHLPKLLFYPMFVYLLVNGAMNCSALFQLLSMPCAATAITFIGAVLFFISDAVLFNVLFNKDSKIKKHFLVMLPYISAELLIVLGLVML